LSQGHHGRLRKVPRVEGWLWLAIRRSHGVGLAHRFGVAAGGAGGGG